MGKIMVFTVPENEEYVLSDISEYLKMKGSYADISPVQDTILIFPNFEMNLYRREVRQNQKSIRLTDLEFRILHYLACQPGRVFTYQQIYE